MMPFWFPPFDPHQMTCHSKYKCLIKVSNRDRPPELISHAFTKFGVLLTLRLLLSTTLTLLFFLFCSFCVVRFLINWLINSLLKLRHPAQLDRQGTNLVHIYGPEVHFDRGASLAFNVFDWNGVPVRNDIVQRLADRSNISLGLGTLCNIIYPEGSDDLPVHITFLFLDQCLCVQIKFVCLFAV